MHLVMIFGPSAVGKMSVGAELAALTGYKLFHNHMSIEPVLDIFDWGTPSFVRLTTEFRRRVIEEALEAELSGLIFTFVWALDDPADRVYVDSLLRPVREAGSRVDFVELYAPQATRLAREGTEPRLSAKRSKGDVSRARELLLAADSEHQLTTDGSFCYPDEHLQIDNTDLSARDAAAQIVARLGLTGSGSAPVPKTVHLLQLPPAVIDALAAGDLESANQASTVTLTAAAVEPANRRVWQRRSTQIRTDPAAAAWITRIIVDAERQRVVGRAGFHGPPDSAGMVEVGYAVDPPYRRQGYAQAALVALLEWAREEPSVRTVRATISPGNVASERLVTQYGFVAVGEQWDDEDGSETIYEVAAAGMGRQPL